MFNMPVLQQKTLALGLLASLMASGVLSSAAWAHHGGESGVLGAQLTTSTVSSPSLAGKSGYSESLWANLLLGMAYARDPQLQRLGKKLKRVDVFTLVTVAGVSGLGLAQSITTLATLNNDGHSTSSGGHHEEGEEHEEANSNDDHHDSQAPAIMGIVGSGVSLGSLATRAVLTHRYGKKLRARQQTIQQAIESILTELESSQNTNAAYVALSPWIGPRASKEFLALWRHTQP